MADFSPHGFVIALLQLGFVLGLLWLTMFWSRRRRAQGKPDDVTVPGFLMLALLVEYLILRYQPIRMGAPPFEYTLGMFDAFSLAGLLFIPILHRAIRRDPART